MELESSFLTLETAVWQKLSTQGLLTLWFPKLLQQTEFAVMEMVWSLRMGFQSLAINEEIINPVFDQE